jgi:hypothetical protein
MMTYIHTVSMREHHDIEIGHIFSVPDTNAAKWELTGCAVGIKYTTRIRTACKLMPCIEPSTNISDKLLNIIWCFI